LVITLLLGDLKILVPDLLVEFDLDGEVGSCLGGVVPFLDFNGVLGLDPVDDALEDEA
jgi:hypothetical protein